MSERELPVARSAKKSKVKERTIAERKYCAVDQFYYSEMFTCPICYGEQRAIDRIVSIIEGLAHIDENGDEMITEFKSDLIAVIKFREGLSEI